MSKSCLDDTINEDQSLSESCLDDTIDEDQNW